MKKILLLVAVALQFFILWAAFQEGLVYRQNELYLSDIPTTIREDTRPPVWSFTIPPIDIMNSYYDYMIGGFNSIPLYVQPDTQYGGYFLTYHGRRTINETRRVFNTHITDSGWVNHNLETTYSGTNEGYPSLAVDPVSGKPFYAWHANVDTDLENECQFAYDAFLFGLVGLISDASTFINNPSTVVPYNTTDNEFIWPSVQIGPSPVNGMRRVYVLTKNTVTHTGGISENVKIAYADFNTVMLEMGSNLTWNYTSIPLLNDWNHDTFSYRRPFFAFTVGNDGRLYYMGYHSAASIWNGTIINEPDLDVFVCNNFGAGPWQRYSASSILPSWNPLSALGTGPGIFTSIGGVPYEDDELFWKINNSGHLNAVYDTNGNLHSSALWSLHNSDGDYYPEYNCVKDLVFNVNSYQFSIREVYPIAGTSPDSLNWQPWDNNGDAIVDQYDLVTGNPIMETQWNYPHWDESAHNNTMMQNYNLIRTTTPNEHGWMASVWQNSWRARQYNKYQDNTYAAYATFPEIFISISRDYGLSWSDPIKINALEVPQFADNRPMWVYPANKIQYTGMVNGQQTGKLALMYFHDNSWGSYVLNPQVGANNGGIIKFMLISTAGIPIVSNGINGVVRNFQTDEPIPGATVSTGISSTITSALGTYILPVAPGIYTLTASKTGFISQTISNISVYEGAFTTQIIDLVPTPTVNVSGVVQGGDPLVPLLNAIVNILNGNITYTAFTNPEGEFLIPNIEINQTYQFSISKQGYLGTTGLVSIGSTDYNMGIITLNEYPYSPSTVLVNIAANNEETFIQWTFRSSPAAENKSKLHSAENTVKADRFLQGFNIWRLSPGQEVNQYMWTLIGITDATQYNIHDYEWSNLTDGYYRYAVKALYSNNQLSSPTFSTLVLRSTICTVSGLVKDPDNNVLSGAEITLTRNIPNGHGPYSCISDSTGAYIFGDVWYGQYNLTCSRDGYQNYEFTNLTVTANINTVFHINLADVLFPPGIANAVINQDSTMVNINWEIAGTEVQRILYGYRIWRLQSGDEEHPENWIVLTNLTENNMYSDTDWINLPSGLYKYAIKAVFSGYLMSEASFTNQLEKPTINPDGNLINQPDKFLGVFPNPSRGKIRLLFNLKQAGSIRFEVYNVHGRLVNSLTRNISNPGNNLLEWTAEDKSGNALPCGVYICRMIIGTTCETKKLIILK